MPGCNANGAVAGLAVGAVGGTTAWPPVWTMGNVKLLFPFPCLNAVEIFVDQFCIGVDGVVSSARCSARPNPVYYGNAGCVWIDGIEGVGG